MARTAIVKVTVEFAINAPLDEHGVSSIGGYGPWKDYVKPFAINLLRRGEYVVSLCSYPNEDENA